MNENNKGNKVLILDGAMGTKLQAAGQKPGEKPEIFGMEHPEIVEQIHRGYIEAGSDIIYTNTFGASRLKLEGTGFTPAEVIKANVAIAKKAAAGRAKVALDMGPLGTLLEPMGPLTFEEAYDMFQEQAVAGEEAGADLIVVETLTDLYEAKAAVLAVRENTSLPVWVTMTFEKNGRTFLGTDVRAMALTLEGLGASAIGVNCSLGPSDLYPIVKELAEWTDLPIIVKPNAGLPDPETGEYPLDAASFKEEMKPFFDLGIFCAGGCCGSSEGFVKGLRELANGGRTTNGQDEALQDEALPGVDPQGENPREAALLDEAPRSKAWTKKKHNGICSAGRVVETDGRVHVIGERINPTGKKRFQQAIRDHDMEYVKALAVAEMEAGADVLDINVGVPDIDEPRAMAEAVKAVQSVADIPLMIDSPNPEAVEAGLRAVKGRAIVNSVSGEQEKQEKIFPVVKKYGAMVLGLAMDESGLPKTADDRVRVAGRILDAAEDHGIPRRDVMIDCLTLTVSAQQDQAMETLEAVRRVRRELGAHAVLGVSNISFGLPARTHVTESFLTQAMFCGLDFPIVNPNEKRIVDAVYSFRVLSGEDRDSGAYIERFSEEDAREKAEKHSSAKPSRDGARGAEGGRDGFAGSVSGKAGGESDEDSPLKTAIYKGLKNDALEAVKELMARGASGEEIINREIIPALDVIGDRYETGKIFLPQMINSANAATKGLDHIKAEMRKSGSTGVSKGKILIATVEGDIHDIGKNIVKVVLENYGYEIIDLGKDVPADQIVEKVREEDIKLVGLSALMTTTAASIKKTVKAIRDAGLECAIMVGGAVVTPKFAEEAGADYYVSDAKASVDVAKKVLG
ncbi:MAG: homocysteine S-methyltransferase family protein [Eubacteriales bacterium]|nr:homocysteine S-methyltransferase family protein [Eubacteriales bacterium]